MHLKVTGHSNHTHWKLSLSFMLMYISSSVIINLIDSVLTGLKPEHPLYHLMSFTNLKNVYSNS